jgi:2-oxoisovalerate dehydrogenase E1 component
VDFFFSSHRSHGHFISIFNDVKLLLSEIAGFNDSINLGRGGSQHIFYKNFFSYGVQGGYMPIAAGVGFSKKNRHSSGIVIAIIGDGTFGEGAVYESLNIISKFEIPVLIIIEDNKYAQSTSIEENFSGSFSGRSEAFDIPYLRCNSFDMLKCIQNFEKSFNYVNKHKKPITLHVETYRFNPHSKSDETRDLEEIKSFIDKDPHSLIKSKINKAKIIEIEKNNRKEILNILKELGLN